MKVQSPSDDTAETSHAAPGWISRLWVALVAAGIAAAAIVFAVIALSPASDADRAEEGIVVFAPDPDGALQLFTIGSDREAAQLTHASGDVVQAEWASDGSAIAYAVVTGDGLADVHVMRADGSQDRIACRECAQVMGVGSSGGGSRIVVSRDVTAIYVSPGGTFVRVAMGYSERIVIHDSREPEEPVVVERGLGVDDRGFRWSPDGERLVFSSRHPGAYNVKREPQRDGIYVVDADGSDLRQLTHPPGPPYTFGPDTQPAWAPDGTRIAFARYLAGFVPGTRLESPGRSEIWTVGLDGSAERQLTTTTEGDYGASAPVWSPDGARLAFLFDGDSSSEDTGINETDVGIVDADGSGLRLIFSCIDDASFRRCPAYGSLDRSPDGGSLSYHGASGTGPFVLAVGGGEPQALSDLADACCVRWQSGPGE